MPNHRARGRPPVYYEDPTTKQQHTASEWATILGLSDYNTFYARLRKWKSNPKEYPAETIFRPMRGAPVSVEQVLPLAPSEARDILETLKERLKGII